MEFTCIDVETANYEFAIIEIAVVRLWPRQQRARVVWHQSLNPEAEVLPRFERITGRNNRMLAHNPTFGDVCGELSRHLSGTHVVSHGPFDRTAILRSAERYNVLPIAREIPWLNSVRIARRVWPDLPNARLGTIAHYLGIGYDESPPKSALDDAKVLARVLARACQRYRQFNVNNWSNIARIGS